MIASFKSSFKIGTIFIPGLHVLIFKYNEENGKLILWALEVHEVTSKKY